MQSLLSPGLTNHDLRPPQYDSVVDAFGLTMLRGGADLSIENGDFALTKDNDLKLGDTPHNALFRLVQSWRFNAPHLNLLFGLTTAMAQRKEVAEAGFDRIDYPLSALGTAGFDLAAMSKIGAQLWDTQDMVGVAEFGRDTYAGSIVMLLSGLLSRFRDGLEATPDEWRKTAPLFNGCSFGQVIAAAANGFRHHDEWAKAKGPDPRRQASQDIISTALAGSPLKPFWTHGRSVEVLGLLSLGNGFEGLSSVMFTFAHNLAMRRRHALKGS